MKLSVFICLASIATFIAALLCGDYVCNILTNASLNDSTFTALLSAVLASQVFVSGQVISFLRR